MPAPVSRIEGVAVPLPVANINTDVIIRIERLAEHGKGELAGYAFEAWRFDAAGRPLDFVLDRPAYRHAAILIAGRNFGCGSSREGAVWALWDFGIRCVVAPSFGDIFYNNCFQNGLVPVVLPQLEVESLATEAAQGQQHVEIDLLAQWLTTPGGRRVPFQMDAVKRLGLLEGRDEISMTLQRVADIDRFQARDRRARPWIYDLDRET